MQTLDKLLRKNVTKSIKRNIPNLMNKILTLDLRSKKAVWACCLCYNIPWIQPNIQHSPDKDLGFCKICWTVADRELRSLNINTDELYKACPVMLTWNSTRITLGALHGLEGYHTSNDRETSRQWVHSVHARFLWSRFLGTCNLQKVVGSPCLCQVSPTIMLALS